MEVVPLERLTRLVDEDHYARRSRVNSRRRRLNQGVVGGPSSEPSASCIRGSVRLVGQVDAPAATNADVRLPGRLLLTEPVSCLLESQGGHS
jgi:hypothetical protein